jgi:hypothetical protein
MAVDDLTSDTLNRLSIKVPGYDTRMNLGTPDPGGSSHQDPPFGYTGFGVHTAFNLFVDVGRVGLYQSNQGSCWQVGGKWLQWSNQDMYMATMGNNTVAADNKMLVAAGCGQGQITDLVSAAATFESPRLVEYNNLALHWRVDGIQVALKEFFYGDDSKATTSWIPYREKKGWTQFADKAQSAQDKYSQAEPSGAKPTGDKKKDAAQKEQIASHYPGTGFLAAVDDFLVAVGLQSNKEALLRAFEWEGDRRDLVNFGSYASTFTALEPFDPYPPSQVKRGKIFSEAYAVTVQVLNLMHRTVDVLKKIGNAITDNFLAKRILNFIQAWQDAQDAVNAYLEAKNIDTSKQWERPGGEQDVFFQHAPAKDQANATAPLTAPATSATLQSAEGPFDTSSLSSPFTLSVQNGSGTGTISFAWTATPPATSGPPWTLTETLTKAGSAPTTIVAGTQFPDRTIGTDQLNAALAVIASGWTASTDDGSTVTLTDDGAGTSSFLTLSGSAAALFFEGNVHDQGEDAETHFDLNSEEGIDLERSMQISFSSLPEDLRDQLRPLYQAAGDWFAVADKATTALGDVIQMFTGLINPPSMLGLIAKDGITLGTTSPLYGTGGGITFVATGKPSPYSASDDDAANPSGPDMRKFIPIFCPWIEGAVQKCLETDDLITKAAKSNFTSPSKIRNNLMPGNFRVAAQNNIVMMAANDVSCVALGHMELVSQGRTHIASAADVHIRSWKTSVRIIGKSVSVGKLEEDKDSSTGEGDEKQVDTQSFSVTVSDTAYLSTAKLRLHLTNVKDDPNGDNISLGAYDTDKHTVKFDKPHVTVVAKDGSEAVKVGLNSGDSTFFGLTVDKSGDVDVRGKTKANLGVDGGGGVEVAADKVTIKKDLYVGTALVVKGSGQLAPGVVPNLKAVESFIAAHKSKHKQIITDATAQKKKYDENKAKAESADDPGTSTFYSALQASAVNELAKLYAQHRDVCNEAEYAAVPLAKIGCNRTKDELLFPPEAKANADPPPDPSFTPGP